MPTFYLMCGIPASGKSAVAEKIAESQKTVILSSDQIRRELYPGEGHQRSQNKVALQELLRRLEQAFAAGQNIIVDSVNRSAYVRRRYAIEAKQRGYHTVCVFCRKSYIYAQNANRLRVGNLGISERILMSLHEQFTPPEAYEGWNEIRIMDGNRYSLEVERQKPLPKHLLMDTTK